MQLERLDNGRSARRWLWPFLILVFLLVAGAMWWRWRMVPSPAICSEAPPAAVSGIPPTPAPVPPLAPTSSPPEVATPPAPAPETAPAEPALATTADKVSEGLQKLNELIEAGKWVEARNYGWAMLDALSDEAARAEVEAKLGAMNVEWVCTPRPMPEKAEVVVKAGDSVARYAQEYQTTVELIQLSNRLTRPDIIKMGDRLRVLVGRFVVVVDTSRKDLLLTLNGKFFKRYRVGTGKYDTTPKGEFVISDRIKEPVWWRPDGKTIPYGDPENILGTHWLALKATGQTPDVRGYGIHGTWDEASIGKDESAGCVRLKNTDVEELFLLLPIGTPVTIR